MTQYGLAIRNFVGPGEVPDVRGGLRLCRARRGARLRVALGVGPRVAGRRARLPHPGLDHHAGRRRRAHQRIKLGTGVLVLPLRNPVVAAKALGSLDVISGGRLVLGVAAGWYAREFDAVGVPFKQRGRIFERNLDILMRLWTEDRVTLKVDEFNLREAVMVPKTAQRPRPPVLIGGYVDAVLKRAGTVGDGWLTYFYTPESFTRSWDKVRAYAREAGRDPATLTSTNQLAVYVGKNREQTTADMRQWLSTEWDVASWSESTIEHAIHGSAEDCVAQLKAHAATGVDRIILIPYRYQPEQVERIAKEVLPQL